MPAEIGNARVFSQGEWPRLAYETIILFNKLEVFLAVTGPLPLILQTKLFRPTLIEDYVRRPELHDRLELVRRRPLTVVCAPAGYGKSVLMGAWLEQCDCYSAWLSLDEGDNDLNVFETYLLSAIQGAVPSLDNSLEDALRGASQLPTPLFAEMLCELLNRLDRDLLIMIDDYGVITNSAIHELINELMRHPHPRLHLILGTRYDPPLPLSQWRIHDQLVEIRSMDLRFSLEESSTFLQRVIGETLDEDMIRTVHKKTEGWVAGLRLAALSFSRIETFRGQMGEISGSNIYISEYLFSQVLSRLPAKTQRFLFFTSILDRVSGSLGRAVALPDKSLEEVQALLQELVTANVFTIPLDQSSRWFRYHHLFRDYLKTKLVEDYSPQFVAALHGQACAWYAAHDYIEEALRHALTANDVETALDLVAANRYELINQGSYQRLSRWLDMFPPEIIKRSPDLLLIKARFAQTVRFDIGELIQLTEMVGTLLKHLHFEPARAQLLTAENEALRAVALLYIDPDAQNALNCCRKALEGLPQEWFTMRSYCWMTGAIALQTTGDISATYEWLGQGRIEDQTASGGPFARNVAAEGFVSWMAGNLKGLQDVGELMLGITSRNGYWESQGWANHFLAGVYYYRNDLESAQHHAQQTFNNRHFHPSANVDSAFILTLVQQALGKPEQAREMLKIAMEFAVEIRSPAYIYFVQCFQAELAVMQGRAQEVVQWAELAYAQMQLSPVISFYAPALTIPKVLLAVGTANGRTMAARCLQRIHHFAQTRHHTRVLIEVLAVQAMLHAANNDQAAALVVLEKSLILAQPGGFIRLYVDLGPKIADLLVRLQNREPYVQYIDSILHAFANGSHLDMESSRNSQLFEPLTDRETVILELLAKRYSNKEIAAELFISPATVKRHTVNLYQKLSVHSRREAVMAGRALELIPPP